MKIDLKILGIWYLLLMIIASAFTFLINNRIYLIIPLIYGIISYIVSIKIISKLEENKKERWYNKREYPCECCGSYRETLEYDYYGYKCCSKDCIDTIELELSPYNEIEITDNTKK
jgi:hypothetical protein